MRTASWSDDDFRSFMTTLRDSGYPSAALTEASRDDFLREVQLRLVPRVQQRMLADIGVTTAAAGVAIIAFEILERETGGKHHTWLLATTDPWGVLAELTASEIRAAYRSTVKASADRKKLKGIAQASSRAQLASGVGPTQEPASASSETDVSTSDLDTAAVFRDADDTAPGDGAITA